MEIVSGQRSAYDASDVPVSNTVGEQNIKKAEKLIREGIQGKPQSWMEARRKQLSDAWKKVNHSDLTLFCTKGKHDHCSFDPECKCFCHQSDDVAMVV